MKRLLLTLILATAGFYASAQFNMAVVDTMKANLAKTKTPKDRIHLMGLISQVYVNTNMPESDRYGEQAIQEAELTRDRALMFDALMLNGTRYLYVGINRQWIQKSIEYYQRALDLARNEKRMEKQEAEALLRLSIAYSQVPQLDKALSLTTQATTIASGLDNDSLKAACQYCFGSIYQAKNERILALRSYFNALRIAEEGKNHALLRDCYVILSQFYADVRSYDKAIDFIRKAGDELKLTKIENRQYQEVTDYFLMGNLYLKKKDYSMAAYCYDQSIRKSDSLSFGPLKMQGYNGLLRTYIQSSQPQKALEFFNARSDLRSFIRNFGMAHVIDQAYGVIYFKLKNYDSAGKYLALAEPGFLTKTTASQKFSFLTLYGDYYRETNQTERALGYYNRALAVADSLGDLESRQRIYANLDTVYTQLGNYSLAHTYGGRYHQLKDSLEKLGDERDLLQMEMLNNEQRDERLKREAEAALERKHTVQYTGIAIGIALVFTILVLLGAFRVSENMIKILGFFAFILFFEFIILLADTKIHHLTHGEPLPVLAIKIVLIALLLPLHHWLEHRVVSYLTSRRLIVPTGKSLWKQITVRTKKIGEKIQ